MDEYNINDIFGYYHQDSGSAILINEPNTVKTEYTWTGLTANENMQFVALVLIAIGLGYALAQD